MRALVVVIFFAVGCAGVESTTRTERGPLLGAFDREQTVEGGARVQLQLSSPEGEEPVLEGAVTAFDTCRVQHVEQYAEEVITEKTASGLGAVVSTGVIGTLGGAVLLSVAQVLSGQPDHNVIDSSGHYGPAPRQVARAWSVVLFVIGVPALAVAGVQLLMTGEKRETRKVDDVASQKDSVCHEHVVDGPLELRDESTSSDVQLLVTGGKFRVTRQLIGKAEPTELWFFGRPLELDVPSRAALRAFVVAVKGSRGP